MSEQQLCAIILEIMQIDPALHFSVVSFCCNFAPEKNRAIHKNGHNNQFYRTNRIIG